MIAKIDTPSGERWAIVLDQTDSLEDVVNLSSGIIEIMISATLSKEILPSEEMGFCLRLLRLMSPTIDQVSEYEKYLKRGK